MRPAFRKHRYYRHATSRRSYYRTLIALYLAADAEGLFCHATNAEIAKYSGLTAATIKCYIHDMEMDGAVATFMPSEGFPRRTIVLLDHPEADAAAQAMLHMGRELGRNTIEGDGPFARPETYC